MNVADLKLPELLAIACEAGGMEAAEKLSEAFGGKVIYIPQPQNCPPNHVLVQVGGAEVAQAICKRFGGDDVEFPRGGKALRLFVLAGLIAKGLNANQACVVMKISWRHVRRLKKQLGRRSRMGQALAAIVAPPRKVGEQIDLEDYLQSETSPGKP